VGGYSRDSCLSLSVMFFWTQFGSAVMETLLDL
jgi:hypothetical protein